MRKKVIFSSLAIYLSIASAICIGVYIYTDYKWKIFAGKDPIPQWRSTINFIWYGIPSNKLM
jgi:hypothetical protein